jgi:hypothetical protein
MWNFVQSLLWTIIAIISIPIVISFTKKQFVKQRNDNDTGRNKTYEWTFVYDADGDPHPGSIFFVLLLILWAIGVTGSIISLTWLKIWLAPKLYLLEYAAALVK